MIHKDFTLSTYKQLLQEFQKNNYKFFTLEQYFTSPLLPFSSSLSLPVSHSLPHNPAPRYRQKAQKCFKNSKTGK